MYLKQRFNTPSLIFLTVFLIGMVVGSQSMFSPNIAGVSNAQTPTTGGGCPSGTTYDKTKGLCVDGPACPQGYGFENGQCVTKTPATCPSDTTGPPDSNGQCAKVTNACPSDTTFQNGNCISTQSTPASCPSGATGPDSQGQCTTKTSALASCPSGATGPDSQGQCTTKTSALSTCPSGATGPDSQGQCTTKTSALATCPQFYEGPDSQGQCSARTGVSGSCPSGGFPSSGLCVLQPVCAPGIPEQNGLCVYGPVICPSGTTLSPGTATCIKIITTPPTCPSGTTLEGAQCTKTTTTKATCPSGTTLEGAQCTKTTTTQATCPSGTTLEGTQCTKTTTTQATCPFNTTFQNGQCVTKTPATCPPDTFGPGSIGLCSALINACPSGTNFQNLECVKTTLSICPAGTSPDDTGTCTAQLICPTGGGNGNGNNGNGNNKVCISCPVVPGTLICITEDIAIKIITDQIMADSHKIDHIFKSSHNLDALVALEGSQQAVVQQVATQIVEKYINGGADALGANPAGIYTTTVTVGSGTTIKVQGTIMNGLPVIGDFMLAR